MMEKNEMDTIGLDENRSTLISLCCEAKINELQKKLKEPEFKKLLTAPLKYRDFKQETILHYIKHTEVEVVQILLDSGAAPCINIGVITPICYASQSNHKSIVRLLLKNGANPEPAVRYTTNPEILAMLQKRANDIRRVKADQKKEKTKEKTRETELIKTTEQKVAVPTQPIDQKLSVMFSFSDASQCQKIADKLASASSFHGIASGLEMLCRACAPTSEKALSEFMVTLLMLPWNLAPFARHVAVDHHGHANRISEALFHTYPAYKVAVYVESKLAAYERDRPRSSFPHLYVTLIEAFVDAIVNSFVGSGAAEDLPVRTSKLLKWLSMVGFISNGTEYTVSLLRFRLMHKTLNLSFRNLIPTQEFQTPPLSSSPRSTSPIFSSLMSATDSPSTSPPFSSPSFSDTSSASSDSDTQAAAFPLSNLSLLQYTSIPSPTMDKPSPTMDKPSPSSPRLSHISSSSPVYSNHPPNPDNDSTDTSPTPKNTSNSTVLTSSSVFYNASTNVLVSTPSSSSPIFSPTSSTPAFLVHIKVKHGIDVSNFKLYSTASLAYLHDKISHRMRGSAIIDDRKVSSPHLPRPILVISKCGRTIHADEEGTVSDLDTSTGLVELVAMLK